jgi:hypothetical protein
VANGFPNCLSVRLSLLAQDGYIAYPEYQIEKLHRPEGEKSLPMVTFSQSSDMLTPETLLEKDPECKLDHRETALWVCKGKSASICLGMKRKPGWPRNLLKTVFSSLPCGTLAELAVLEEILMQPVRLWLGLVTNPS